MGAVRAFHAFFDIWLNGRLTANDVVCTVTSGILNTCSVTTSTSNNNKKGRKYSTINTGISLIHSKRKHHLHPLPSSLVPLNILPGVLALLSDLLAILVQQEWDRNKCNAQEA